MRKRWTVGNPTAYVVGWFLVGMAAFMTVCALTNPCDSTGACGMNANTLSAAAIVTLCIWLAPFALAALAALVVFGGAALWHGRPRRIEEPVHEDLRLADLRKAAR